MAVKNIATIKLLLLSLLVATNCRGESKDDKMRSKMEKLMKKEKKVQVHMQG